MLFAAWSLRRPGQALQESRPVNLDESRPAARQDHARSIADFTFPLAHAAVAPNFPAFDDDVLADRHRLAVLDGHLSGHCMIFRETADFGHRFIQEHGDDAAVHETRAALIVRGEPEPAADSLRRVVLLEGELHSAGICAAAAKTEVRRIGCQEHPGRVLKSAPLAREIPRERRAAACEALARATRTAFQFPGQCAFRPRRQIPGGACWGAAAASKNSVPARTLFRARARESATRLRRIPPAR